MKGLKEEIKRKEFTGKIIIYLTVCFFLSGMCGLIYQVVWSRMLCLTFGHTTFAISTVITAFMGGLALGSYFLGRWADSETRFKKLLDKKGVSSVFLMYGILEAFIGIYCLCTPELFKFIEFIYLNFSSLPFYFLSILRFILCIIVLIIPTLCMGGTLPLLSKFLIRNSGELSNKLGFLYFINTLGAVFGTVISGFYLISHTGLKNSLYLAAAINIGIGLLVYVLNKNETSIFTSNLKKAEENKSDTNKNLKISAVKNLKLLVIVFAFAGFASMIYELAWTRALALALSSSTYAFSTMLATFLFGIALGSVFYSYFSGKINFNEASFGWLEVFIGLTCLFTIPILGRMPLYVIKFFPVLKSSYNMIIFAYFIICFMVMLIPTTLMGFVFPLVGKLYTQSIKEIGKSIGNIYAVNTIGCILGSFLTGFILIPFMGVQNSLKLAVIINLLAGGIFLLQYYKEVLYKTLIVISLIIVVIISNYLPSWNPAVMSSGSAIYADIYSVEYSKARAEGKKFFDEFMLKYLVYQKDGISCTVSVYNFDNNFVLRVNGKTDASSEADMPTQLMLGYIPLLYKENPENVFIIGLGSGVTVKAVLDFPEVQSVVCAEIEPAIIEASKFFEPLTGDILSDKRFEVQIADGRNALLAAKKDYDVIISEPSNPWIAGIGNLFTRDFYEISKGRLSDDGIFCQWLHLTRMDSQDVKRIIRTFYSVFPKGIIWRGKDSDLLLLGSKEELVFDYERFKNSFRENESFRNSLKNIGITDPNLIFLHYITTPEAFDDIMAGSLNTDDLPVLEFSAPRSLYLDTVSSNIKLIYNRKSLFIPPIKNMDGPLPVDFYINILDFYYKYMPETGDMELEKLLRLYPQNISLNIYRTERLIKNNYILLAKKNLEILIAKNRKDYRLHLALAELYYKQSFFPEAKKEFFLAHIYLHNMSRKNLYNY